MRRIEARFQSGRAGSGKVPNEYDLRTTCGGISTARLRISAKPKRVLLYISHMKEEEEEEEALCPPPPSKLPVAQVDRSG